MTTASVFYKIETLTWKLPFVDVQGVWWGLGRGTGGGRRRKWALLHYYVKLSCRHCYVCVYPLSSINTIAKDFLMVEKLKYPLLPSRYTSQSQLNTAKHRHR